MGMLSAREVSLMGGRFGLSRPPGSPYSSKVHDVSSKDESRGLSWAVSRVKAGRALRLAVAAALVLSAVVLAAPDPALAYPAKGFSGKGEYRKWDKSLAFYKKGNELFQSGRYAEAIKQYEEAVDIYPLHYDAYANLALARLRNGDLAGAEDAYREALKIHPHGWDAWNNLGIVLQKRDKFQEASHAFSEALLCHPPEKEIDRLKNSIRDLEREYILRGGAREADLKLDEQRDK